MDGLNEVGTGAVMMDGWMDGATSALAGEPRAAVRQAQTGYAIALSRPVQYQAARPVVPIAFIYLLSLLYCMLSQVNETNPAKVGGLAFGLGRA